METKTIQHKLVGKYPDVDCTCGRHFESFIDFLAHKRAKR